MADWCLRGELSEANFLARVFALWVGFSSFAGSAKQVFKMRNFFYALALLHECTGGEVGLNCYL